MNWETSLDYYGELVEKRLASYFDAVVKEARDYHPFIADSYSDLREFVLRRGKRLISCSTLLTYKGYTGRVDANILNACIGIEIFRHCILVHDDLVDADCLRRGGRTLHRKFTENFDDRFGEGTAIFIGDIAYALTMHAITNSGFPQERIDRSLLLLLKGYQEINESQILDLLFSYKNVDVDEWHVMASKRAPSLFKATMLMGAILGEAPENELRTLGEAAVNIGYSFDIQDDIIDTFAQEKHYGRPPCGDVILGKKPLHVIYALNSADRKSSSTLKNLLGKKSLTQEDVELIRTIIRESGGLETAKEISKQHAKKARALIVQTSMHEDVKDFFRNLIAYMEESLEWYN